tara:strand:- start:41 stop:1114 length:1074 start_codon:yes stop_codon:yes gene_type:complete
MKHLMKSMDKKEVNNIIKECNKKPVEKKYLPHTLIGDYDEDEEEHNKNYSITGLEEYKKILKKYPERLEFLINMGYNDEDFNNFKLEELEITTDKKIRKPDDMNEDPENNRCYAMVWGGGKGGRCKSKLCSNGLCKLHYNGIINDKRLLAYGHYNITGENSVPDLDGKKLRRYKNGEFINEDNELDELNYNDTNELLLLKPLNKKLLWVHSNHYKSSKITGEYKNFNEYMDSLEFSKKELKHLKKFYNPKDYEEKEIVEEPEEKNEEPDMPTEEDYIMNELNNSSNSLLSKEELEEDKKKFNEPEEEPVKDEKQIAYLNEMADIRRNNRKKNGEYTVKGNKLIEKVMIKYKKGKWGK